MITELQTKNFKSWRDTGSLRLAPLTGLFGANSSGKTAILQLLLLLKQTAELADRSRVLHFGDQHSYIDLGTFLDVVHGHKEPGQIEFRIEWTLPGTLEISNPEYRRPRLLFSTGDLAFGARIEGTATGVSAAAFGYGFQDQEGAEYQFGMARSAAETSDDQTRYDLVAQGYELKRGPGRPWPLPSPVKCYGFPDQVYAQYQNAGFLSEFVLAFEQLFQAVYYLGPLREYPKPSYTWAGDQPGDVGRRGEDAIAALLASGARGATISRGRGRRKATVEERVAQWLKDLRLIEEFRLEPIAPNRKEYEVRVRQSAGAPEVHITDVGFGVSQILPVLVLCYYAPEGSTIILEQPEIHLHPSVQAGLADVFIDAIQTRHVQIILESHSEYLLRRLQRRIAEGALSHEQAALYFTAFQRGQSSACPLELDLFGNITNWPPEFFGDEMADLVAMTEAQMNRQPSKDSVAVQ